MNNLYILIEYIDGHMWKLSYEYKWRSIIVPKGFITDGTSLPRFLYFWVRPTGKSFPAAIVHDYLYKTHICSKKEADLLFLQHLKELNIRWTKIYALYIGVKMFGWIGWNKYKKNRKTI